MKTPLFWSKNGIIPILLCPFSLVYYTFYKLRCLINLKPYKSKIPVICIGNIIAGGAGKTPIAIAISKILKDKNKKFCFLSKGYGGNFKGVVKLDKNSSFNIVGDEPVLLYEYGDVFISKNRVQGLKYINKNYDYDYIIIDDGLQNPTFIKDKSILVIDGNFGFGNGFIVPAGPLRETFNNVKSKIDCVIINGEDKNNIWYLCAKNKINYVNSKIQINFNEKYYLNEYIAFCGIGRPEKFLNTLKENDINVKDFIIFEDHHIYKNEELDDLVRCNCKLLTTTKDYVKIPNKYRDYVDYLEIYTELNDDKIMEIINV